MRSISSGASLFVAQSVTGQAQRPLRASPAERLTSEHDQFISRRPLSDRRVLLCYDSPVPDGKPTKAPLIIFGGILGTSIISVGIVVITHLQRTEPYLDSKMRREIRMKRPAEAPPPTPSMPSAEIPLVRLPEPGPLDAGVEDASSEVETRDFADSQP